MERLRLLQLPLRRDGLDGHGGAGLQGDGGRFTASRWRGCTLGESAFRCANFAQSRWKKCCMENCQLRRAVLAEADVVSLSPHRTGFQEVDFFARR
ncbi:pentapeptide repeat-containing protein [Flavonifractor plautii]|nr:pentapeptide repeat-containing protein [Flavonifractor plautii]